MSKLVKFYDKQSSEDTYRQFHKVLEMVGPLVRIIEIGSWTGESAIRWLQAHTQIHEKPCEIICVDHWRAYPALTGSRMADEMNKRLEEGRVFHRFLDRIEQAGYSDYVHPLRIDANCLSDVLKVEQAGLVYVDGAHDAPTAYRDIVQAKALVRPGGIICGDDFDVRPKDLPRYQAATLTQDNVHGFHPGVTDAIIKVFGDWESFNRLWWKRVNAN